MSHLLQSGVQALLLPLRLALFAAMRAVALRHNVGGIEVIDTLAGATVATRIPKVAAALTVIGSHHPVLLGRVRRYLSAVVINDSRTGYLAYRRACVLNSHAIDVQSAEEIAFDLVHEATHAVFHRAGVRYDGVRRGRIERACVRAEMRLARQLPTGTRYLDHIEAKLGQVWWDDEQLRAGREAELRAAGVPEWLIAIRRKIGIR